MLRFRALFEYIESGAKKNGIFILFQKYDKIWKRFARKLLQAL